MWLWIVLGVVGLFVLLMLVMWAVGRRLPEEHVISSSVDLRTTCEEAWQAIADTAGHPAWANGVARVERLPDRNGHETVRMFMGRSSFVLETTRSEPPRALVRTIADDSAFFSGRWEYALAPHDGGCRVTLTEHGRVRPAVPRFLMRYVMNPTVYLKRHLQSLQAKFG